jgi:methyl-accepting chemotaxis protein
MSAIARGWNFDSPKSSPCRIFEIGRESRAVVVRRRYFITGIQNSIGTAVASVKEVGVAMRQIDEVTTAIASAVEQQGAATREISQNVQMAASGTQTLASSISTVNAAIEETNRSADHVLDASGKVAIAATSLAEQVKAFFITLRNGPMDRREHDDPNFKGPNRREGSARDRSGSTQNRKVA